MLLGDTTLETFGDSNGAGQAQAWPYTATITGTATDIEVYVNTGNAATRIGVGLYSNASGHPSSRLTYASITTIHAGAWNDITVPSVNVTAGTQYWLAILGTGGTAAFRDKAAGTCATSGSQTNQTSMPATWSQAWQVTGYCPGSIYLNGTTPAPIAPANTTLPAISGTAQQGQTLTATQGSWSGTTPITYAYQWQDCAAGTCQNITGATSSTYTPVANDVGHTVDVIVTATNAAGSTQATSKTVGPITAPPSSGLLVGDSNVETNHDSNATNAQAWQYTATASGTAGSISGYVDGTGPVSLGLYADNGGQPGTLLDSATISTPTSGAWNKASLNGGVQVQAGTSYWLAWVSSGSDGFRDNAAGSCKYALSSATSLAASFNEDLGSGTGYCPASLHVDTPDSPSAPQNTTAPTIGGTTSQGATLTADPGNWTGYPSPTFAYQWQDCTSSGCSNISGATSKTYTLAASDVGDTIDVVVTASNSQGSATATSAKTAQVTAPSSGQPVGDPLGKTWTAGFSDEFNGTSVDTSKWVSLQAWYLNNANPNMPNCTESGGNLILALPGDGTACDLATDQNGFDSYSLPVGGYFEARVWFPGPGSSPTSTIYNWPTVWALGVAPTGGSGEHGGEIDVAEGLNNLQVNYHSPTADINVANPAGQWGNSWHVYGVYRSATQDQIFWDGNLVGTVTTSDDGSPQSLMLTSGATNSCCGAPAQTGPAGNVLIDWVRTYS